MIKEIILTSPDTTIIDNRDGSFSFTINTDYANALGYSDNHIDAVVSEMLYEDALPPSYALEIKIETIDEENVSTITNKIMWVNYMPI